MTWDKILGAIWLLIGLIVVVSLMKMNKKKGEISAFLGYVSMAVLVE
ncbi:hypothetical protein MKY30_06315 [Oceanobacillus sp. FSL W8-0428]|uniref:Uncharacterized protein n=1 Tax=Oceanobacillus sojae TaxID=582851 RepID=A0A511ZPG8_9BACI|nr:hypothetical protein [Oceanobacillus sojae]GEN89356.1 hypothetical protein OSO01_40950 [Oceanobacillus sojae]